MTKTNRSWVSLAAIGVSSLSLLAVACSGDDSSNPSPTPDAGSDAGSDAGNGGQADATAPTDASTDGRASVDASDASTDGAPTDGTAPADGGDGGTDASDASRVDDLLFTTTASTYASSNYGAFDLDAGTRATGTATALALGGNTVNTTSKGAWILDRGNARAYQLAATPTDVRGSYALPASSNPNDVAENDTKAYVPLLARNAVAVLDTTQAADAGAPVKQVDLSQFLVAGDTDGSVDPTAVAYDATRKRVWVLLGGYDTKKYDSQLGGITCLVNGVSRLVAIDTTNDTLVAGVSYALASRDASGLTYDPKNDRVLVTGGGCLDGANANAITGRVIEAIKLADGTSTVLLDGNAKGYLGTFVYGDEHHAFVQFGADPLRAWDPAVTTLGAAVGNAPSPFVWEPAGTLLGIRANVADAGTTYDVVRYDVTAQTTTVVGTQSPFAPGVDVGYVASLVRYP